MSGHPLEHVISYDGLVTNGRSLQEIGSLREKVDAAPGEAQDSSLTRQYPLYFSSFYRPQETQPHYGESSIRDFLGEAPP